ncbi:MAG: TonB family protein, partial [Bacteroidales bacterium]|nr:TonB family protein [Candidatus Cacconaster merdequi]
VVPSKPKESTSANKPIEKSSSKVQKAHTEEKKQRKPFAKYGLIGGIAIIAILSVVLFLNRDGQSEPVDSIMIDGTAECVTEFESSAAEREFKIEKNFAGRWTYSGIPEWGTAKGAEDKITLTISENTAKEDRKATIEFKKKDGDDILATLTINQKAKKTTTQNQLEEKFGSVKLTSNPSGATIWIDGKNTKKTTPDIIDKLTGGNHKVIFKLAGYEDASRNVFIKESGHSELSCNLTKLSVNEQQNPSTVDDECIPLKSNLEPEVQEQVPSSSADNLCGNDEVAIPLASVEKEPSFMGGNLSTFSSWVISNLNYPAIAKENGIQGRVILKFIVEKDGRVSNVKVYRSVDPSLDKEAVRVVSGSPKWTPGMVDGRYVRVSITLPVNFQLR